MALHHRTGVHPLFLRPPVRTASSGLVWRQHVDVNSRENLAAWSGIIQIPRIAKSAKLLRAEVLLAYRAERFPSR